MSLVPQQWAFAKCIAKLIPAAEALGFVLAGKELGRSKLEAWVNSQPAHSRMVIHLQNGLEVDYPDEVGGYGIQNSLHISDLAEDYAIFRDGVCLTCGATTPQLIATLKPLGDLWESLDPHCKWGGYFVHPRPDPDHFEWRPDPA